MNIGDKVRLLRGREEGIIVGFGANNIVQVEIEDGFQIPALRSEIVVVAAEEAQRFRREEPVTRKGVEPRATKEVVSAKGIFFAFILLNDVNLAFYFINNTDYDLPYTLGEVRGEDYRGLQGGVLKRKTSVKVTEVSTQNFEGWPSYLLQMLFFREGSGAPREPLTRKIRFRANTFFKNKTKAPLLDKDAYLLQLDKEETAVEIKPAQIVEGLFDKAAKPPAPDVPKPPAEVDLHIEKLADNYSQMSSPDIIGLQLRTFEKSLENAIATGMPEITFIHGVGNGVLRTELHRRLSKHPNVKFYQDARKEKFGYGATVVSIK
jgi:hypothetical protein